MKDPVEPSVVFADATSALPGRMRSGGGGEDKFAERVVTGAGWVRGEEEMEEDIWPLWSLS